MRSCRWYVRYGFVCRLPPRGFTISAGSLAQDRRWLFHPCFATRLGGVSGGRETQGWRDSSHTLMVGARQFGSAKLPMATATYPGKPSPSQYTVQPHVRQQG